MSDFIAEHISRVALGDHAAFKQLYDRTSSKLFGICLRILTDRADAEDVLQEVYVKVWNKADRFSTGQAGGIAWLAAIARNQAIDRLRSRKRIRSSATLEIRSESSGLHSWRSAKQTAVRRGMDQSTRVKMSTIRVAALPSHRGGIRKLAVSAAIISRYAARIRVGSVPTKRLLPTSIVIGRSVFSRIVRHGTFRIAVSS